MASADIVTQFKPRGSAQPSFPEQNTSSIIANREGHEFTRAAVG